MGSEVAASRSISFVSATHICLTCHLQPRTLELEHFLGGGIDEEVIKAGYEVPMMHYFDPKDPTAVAKKMPFRDFTEPTPSMPEVCLKVPFVRTLL